MNNEPEPPLAAALSGISISRRTRTVFGGPRKTEQVVVENLVSIAEPVAQLGFGVPNSYD
jgi:hypothetical protein